MLLLYHIRLICVRQTETKNNITVVSVFSNLRQSTLLLTLKSVLSNDRKMLFSHTLLLEKNQWKNVIPDSEYVTLRYNYFLCDEIK